ncbi:polygalacturonase-like [Cylas formicarius]|uniref:polygalacturonase-like n=1 Tax=Cylas formicarius TaxID=197179 RepID=UPI002958A76E|nr:polygalacturonase-like [Cylas formicarius]
MLRIYPFLLQLILQGLAYSVPQAEPCVVSKFDNVVAAVKECSNILFDNLFVPAGITLKLNLTDGAVVTFRGNTTFGFTNWFGPLVTINGTGIVVQGEAGSVFDGQGQLYWDDKGTRGTPKPQFFTIEAFHSIFRNINVLNCPVHCVQPTNAINVTFTDWFIDNRVGTFGVAPRGHEGHSTDGFDVWNSTDVVIQNSVVYNQDDCVALRCGSNILVRNLFCSGTHGLSISVGFSNTSVQLNTLTNVTILDSVVVNSINAIHIKTHRDGGYGSITNVTYQNITMTGLQKYGVFIQENYPDSKAEPRNNVVISDLQMIDVSGDVSDSAFPVYVLCADDGCVDWKWSGVDIAGNKSNFCNFEIDGFDC